MNCNPIWIKLYKQKNVKSMSGMYISKQPLRLKFSYCVISKQEVSWLHLNETKKKKKTTLHPAQYTKHTGNKRQWYQKFCLCKKQHEQKDRNKRLPSFLNFNERLQKCGSTDVTFGCIKKRVHWAVFLYRKNYIVIYSKWTMHLFLCFCLHTTL